MPPTSAVRLAASHDITAQAIHLCQTAFYPHSLTLVRPSKTSDSPNVSHALGRSPSLTSPTRTDVAFSFDQPRASHHINVPLARWFESRHRGQEITVTPKPPHG